MAVRRRFILASLIAITTMALAAGAPETFRNAEGETPLQVALRESDRGEVVRLLTETQVAYFETFTRGPAPHDTPLPSTDLDHAFSILLGLVREHPRLPALNFSIGTLSIKRNDLGRAELALERVLQAAPDNHRAGVELARVCALSGQHDAARRHYEHVLGQDPPPNVTRNIQDQLAALNHLSKRFQLSARFDAGAIADDNVNVGPNSDSIAVYPFTVGGLEYTALYVAPSSQPIDAEGAYAAATVAMLYDGGRPGHWGLSSDINYYENWLDEAEQETRLAQVALGLKHAAKHSLFQGSVRAGRIWTGSDTLVDTISIAPAYLRTFASRRDLHWISTALLQQREYDTRNAYDGLYAALEQVLRVMLSERASLFAGLRATHNNADHDAFTYTGLSSIAGASTIWGRLRLYASARYTRNDYDQREALAPEDRVDTQWLINAKASLRLMGNTGIELKHQYTDNGSTFDLYDYERNVTMVGLWGRF